MRLWLMKNPDKRTLGRMDPGAARSAACGVGAKAQRTCFDVCRGREPGLGLGEVGRERAPDPMATATQPV